ncbi:PqqD family protein [Prevotella sp. tf2-5]|uniref:PqqD family protein n=1 Tax=Prevotella sp. tf2-5 TaxID=1761889 RepID=UPI0008E0BDB1|nr:PqqD family protein [Prevotella sp. tf2-5]SFP03377.1 Coenzyme PQQ synthesis protein D (PqqD) [Prevotella sp. tf2-5]
MKLNYEFSIQEVADKFVAVAKNTETETVEQVFNLNESGAVILKALQEGKDVPAIVSLLLSQYDVEPQEAEDEVNAFVNMLKVNGLCE